MSWWTLDTCHFLSNKTIVSSWLLHFTIDSKIQVLKYLAKVDPNVLLMNPTGSFFAKNHLQCQLDRFDVVHLVRVPTYNSWWERLGQWNEHCGKEKTFFSKVKEPCSQREVKYFEHKFLTQLFRKCCKNKITVVNELWTQIVKCCRCSCWFTCDNPAALSAWKSR